MNTIQVIQPKTFVVTVENFDGKCKRVKIVAHSPEDAMALAQKGGWYPVDVQAA
jgi:hypothetical protein